MVVLSLWFSLFLHLIPLSFIISQGEFNSGKSTIINALLGRRYLKEGVVPTTNEITLLCYSEAEKSEKCESHPDGQFICYLPAPILKEVSISEIMIIYMNIYLIQVPRVSAAIFSPCLFELLSLDNTISLILLCYTYPELTDLMS